MDFIPCLVVMSIAVVIRAASAESFDSVINDSNCTRSQMSTIDECNKHYPSELLSSHNNLSPTNESTLIFANASRIELLKRSCSDYSKYAECTGSLEKATKDCLSNLIDVDKTAAFFTYLCKDMLSMVVDPKTSACWTGARMCKLLASKTDPLDAPGVCLLLNSIDLQLNCALDQATVCLNPTIDDLRKARSETSNFMTNFKCDEEPTEDEEKINRTTVKPSERTRQTEDTSPTVSRLSIDCSPKQNSDAGTCLKELWGIEKHMQALSGNGSFWVSAQRNDSSWLSACRQVLAHQECIESKMEQDDAAQSPCTFQVQMHNFAAFMQTLCDEDIFQKVIYPKCKVRTETTAHCRAISDYMNDNFTSMMKDNNPGAYCKLYRAPRAYFDCITEDMTSCTQDVEKVLSNIEEYGSIVGCFNRTMPTKDIHAPTIEKDMCSDKMKSECARLELDPITIVYNTEDTTEGVCSMKKQIDECASCKYSGTSSALKSIYEYICGPGMSAFQNSRGCLAAVNNQTGMRNCRGQYFEKTVTNVSCNLLNSFLGCSYPILLDRCGASSAEYHLNILHNLASNTDTACRLHKPDIPTTSAAPGLPQDPSIVDYINCTNDETNSLVKCSDPFKKLLVDLEDVGKGGLTAIINSLKNVSKTVKEGCKLRKEFHTCAQAVLTHSNASSSQCRITSCMVKVGDTACSDNVTTKSLETSIRCMFTLITDSKFQQCTKIFPKDAFQAGLSKLKAYLPEFIGCIKEPILRKCGNRSWALAKAFTSGKGDPSCILDLSDAKSWSFLPQPEPEPEPASSATVNSETASDVTSAPEPSPSIGAVPEPVPGNKSDLLINNLIYPICTTERIDKFEDCANVLGDYKPAPIMIFDDVNKLDKACPLYSKYQNCLHKYNCTYPLAEAYKSLLYNVCTTYYDAFKSDAVCLKRAAYNNRVQVCINKFQATDLRSVSAASGQLGCKAITELLKCAGDFVDMSCGPGGLDLLYNLYRPFASKLDEKCSPNRTDIGSPMKECTREERNVYFKCRGMVPINPISFMNGSRDYNETCNVFGSEFQTCLNKAPCLPQPAHQAFNDTLTYLCFAENKNIDFDQFGACLTNVSNTKAGMECTKAFNQITWDDPGRMVCRKFNQAMNCAYPLIAANCHQDSLIFVYDVFSLMALRYRSGCLLDVPPNVKIPDKFANITGPVPIFVTRPVFEEPLRVETTTQSSAPSLANHFVSIGFASILAQLFLHFR